MNDRYLISITVPLILILAGCSTFSGDDKGRETFFPYETAAIEAEQMALLLSDELYAPEELFDYIYSDMALIREQIGPRFVDVTLKQRWSRGCIDLAVDDETYFRMENDLYDAWRDLHEEIDPISIELASKYRVTIWFARNLNVRHLIEIYRTLPGVMSAHSCSRARTPDPPGRRRPVTSGNIYLQRTSEGIEYLFMRQWGYEGQIEYLHIFFIDGKVHMNQMRPEDVDRRAWL